jgi:hypothetical protein
MFEDADLIFAYTRPATRSLTGARKRPPRLRLVAVFCTILH